LFQEIEEQFRLGCEEMIMALSIGNQLVYGLLKTNRSKTCADSVILGSIFDHQLYIFTSQHVEGGDNIYYLNHINDTIVFSIREHLFHVHKDKLSHKRYSSELYGILSINQRLLLTSSKEILNDEPLNTLVKSYHPTVTGITETNKRVFLSSLNQGVFIIYKHKFKTFDFHNVIDPNKIALPVYERNDTLSLFNQNCIYQLSINNEEVKLLSEFFVDDQIKYKGGYNHIHWVDNHEAYLNYYKVRIDRLHNLPVLTKIFDRGKRIKKTMCIYDSLLLTVTKNRIGIFDANGNEIALCSS
jgi:hypothetical protein